MSMRRGPLGDRCNSTPESVCGTPELFPYTRKLDVSYLRAAFSDLEVLADAETVPGASSREISCALSIQDSSIPSQVAEKYEDGLCRQVQPNAERGRNDFVSPVQHCDPTMISSRNQLQFSSAGSSCRSPLRSAAQTSVARAILTNGESPLSISR